ncbi:MAG: L-aspartate oxidase [Gemmataceae bacterium]|nr:L-aspartate oxidase [Gemmataceae bacterium]
MTHLHRYLVQFSPKHTPHVFTDILVIGAGIAGLRAALAVPDALDVLVVTKDKIRLSSSSYAQGGIATVLSPEDRFENHIEDTIKAGGGLCQRDIVEMVVREAPEQIADLISWGTHFDEEDGHLALTREGGHSHRRIVHALGDATGFEVMRAIIEHARKMPHITLWDDAFTLDLLTHEGRCVGALVHRGGHGKLLVWAKQTILASGGAGMVYRETTNPPVATGDGMAAAYRAGAELRDMEFMQFHPTVLYVAGSSRFLISEALRGEGAYLRDKNMDRFMLAPLTPDLSPKGRGELSSDPLTPNPSPSGRGEKLDTPGPSPSMERGVVADPRAELAPRDVVAQAIVRQMEKTKHPNVYLDLRHLDPALVRRRFPGIDKMCRGFGLDITADLIPVRPGAHYMIGGVTVDERGQTALPGLWAAGEVTSSGLHGANRLASNSLLEGLVFGTACGRGAAEAAAQIQDRFTALPIANRLEPETDGALDVPDLTSSLRSLMVRHMGVIRDQSGLEQAQRDVAFWCRYVLRREFDARSGWELQNLLTIARLMIHSALERTESRGVHFRGDYPQSDEHWQRHIACAGFECLFSA